MFCTKCGAQILEGAVFCSNCGSKLEVAAKEVMQEPPQTPLQGYDQTPPQGQPQGFAQVPPQATPQSYDQTPPQGVYTPLQAPAKKSKAVPILIALIAVALIAAGVLLFLFVFNKKGGGIVGKYHAAAMEMNGMTLDVASFPGMDTKTMTFDLQEGGTGTASVNGDEHPITWKLEGELLDITTEDGKSMADALSSQGGKMEFKNGRIIVIYEEGGMSGSMILAKDGDDLSDIEMTSMADFITQMGSSINQ